MMVIVVVAVAVVGVFVIVVQGGGGSKQRRAGAGVAVAVVVVVLLHAAPAAPAQGSLQGTRTCQMDTTSLAVLSCQEWPPSGSCCDALRYAINEQPSDVSDRGLCCLCVYICLCVSDRGLSPSTSRMSTACAAERMRRPSPPGSLCSLLLSTTALILTGNGMLLSPRAGGGGAGDPAGGGSSTGGGSGGTKKKKQQQQHLSSWAILGIVVGTLLAIMVISWCAYRFFFLGRTK
uniref:Uncharacterized protein n=1 Tax=Oryza meridionalis TaxID=40149 RepID=A0A0E0DV51_9ORYZ